MGIITTTPRYGLPALTVGSQGSDTYLMSLYMLDALVGAAVLSTTLTAPPVSPVEGDSYILPAGCTGAWRGSDGHVATWAAGFWNLQSARIGMTAWDEATARLYRFTSAGWSPEILLSLTNAAAAPLGTAAAGTSGAAARGDHVHPYPTAAQIGAAVMTASMPAPLGTAAAVGVAADAAHADHVHPFPTAAQVGAPVLTTAARSDHVHTLPTLAQLGLVAGANITFTAAGATTTISAAAGGITIANGTTTLAGITVLDFEGAGIVLTSSGTTATATIAGSAAASGVVLAGLLDWGTVGGATAVQSGANVTLTAPSGGTIARAKPIPVPAGPYIIKVSASAIVGTFQISMLTPGGSYSLNIYFTAATGAIGFYLGYASGTFGSFATYASSVSGFTGSASATIAASSAQGLAFWNDGSVLHAGYGSDTLGWTYFATVPLTGSSYGSFIFSDIGFGQVAPSGSAYSAVVNQFAIV
jgi:Protein of unknown function (DUF2793)